MQSAQDPFDRLRQIFEEGEADGSIHVKPISSLTGNSSAESKTTTSQAGSTRRPGAAERLLTQNGYPLTRENWLKLAYPTGLPDEWTQELEEELPPQLRRPVVPEE